MSRRTLWFVAFYIGLHLLVLARLWRGTDDRIAEGVAVLSVIPIGLTVLHFLPKLFHALTWLDVWVMAYALFSVVSGVLYLQPDNPSAVASYGFGLYHFVLPVACYFAAKSIPEADHQRLVSALVLLNAFAVGYGLLLHLTRPDHYLVFVQQQLAQKGYTEEWQYFARLQSYLGSTTMGYLSAVSIVLMTIAAPRVQRFLPVLAPLFIVGAALSMQRGSIIGCAVALLYLAFLARGNIALRFTLGIVLAAGIAYVAVRFRVEAQLYGQLLQSRATTEMAQGIKDMLSDRGYGPGLAYVRDFPLGVGLGGTSSGAASAGLAQRGEVSDANFMRIAADLGLVGLFMFLTVLLAAALAAWRSRRRAAWTTFLIIHAGIMLATNVHDSFYISHSFWLLLAIIDRDHPGSDFAVAPAPAPVVVPKTVFG